MKNRRDFLKRFGILGLGTFLMPAVAASETVEKQWHEGSAEALWPSAVSPPNGFRITLVPSGPVQVLNFRPQNAITGDDMVQTASLFFHNLLYDLPDKMGDCRLHFKQLYGKLPANRPYFYAVEKHFNVEGLPKNRYCFPLGPGDNVLDAYATYLLSPHIEPSREGVFSEGGHFVKASFVGTDMNFEPLAEDYVATKKKAHVLSRERLKKITLSVPLNDAPIPGSLQYSAYWLGITQKYEAELKQQRAFDRMNTLNDQFAKAEKEFYDAVKLYQEYSIRQAEAARSAAMIGLMLEAAKFGADMSSSNDTNTLKSEVKQLQANEKILVNEVQRTKDAAMESLRKANEIRNSQVRELKLYNIPLNDDPKLDTAWLKQLN